MCLYLCSFYLYLVYDLIINKLACYYNYYYYYYYYYYLLLLPTTATLLLLLLWWVWSAHHVMQFQPIAFMHFILHTDTVKCM